MMSALGQKATSVASAPCPLYPQKRTLELSREMSALCQKQTSAHLLNHLIGASKQRRRHIKAERLGRLEIDH
jgi:hypothetical protein